jgi:hypothetical protein
MHSFVSCVISAACRRKEHAHVQCHLKKNEGNREIGEKNDAQASARLA